MKKNGLIKVLLIAIALLLVLSWIIPVSQFSGSEMAKADISRIGIFDVINYPLLSFQYFIQMILFILVVGGFYGLLNKTGKYTELVEKISKSLKGKEKLFLVITAFLFAGMSSVLGLSIILFIFIPFVVSIILLLGYDKIVALLTTVGSIFVGIIGATYNLYVTGYINQMLGLTYNESALLIVSKLTLFVLPFVLFMMFTLGYTNKVKKSSKNSVLSEKTEDIFLGEKPSSKSKKKAWPLIVVGGLLLVLVVLGCTPWKDVFGIKAFSTFNTWLTGLKIGDFTIIAYILGEIGELGTWYFGEMTLMVLIASLIVAIAYKIKFDDAIVAFGEGAQKLLRIVVIMAIAMVVVIITAYHPFFSTVTSWLVGWMDSFNVLSVFLTSVVAILGSALNIEVIYMAQTILPYIAVLFENAKPVVAVLFQAMYGLTMFVAPTSLLLILGLEYLQIPYKTWLKFSWKLVLGLLAVVLAILVILALAI